MGLDMSAQFLIDGIIATEGSDLIVGRKEASWVISKGNGPERHQ